MIRIFYYTQKKL